MACRKITLIVSAVLLLAAITHSAPAEKLPAPAASNPEAAEAKQDLAVEDKDDLKPAASHWGGLGYGYGGYGGWGHYGGYYPYYSSWGWPSYGYGYGYGYPYYGGFGHGGGYWW